MARYLRGLTWQPVDALEPEHARITIPVRLIWGADDPTFPAGWRGSCPTRASSRFLAVGSWCMRRSPQTLPAPCWAFSAERLAASAKRHQAEPGRDQRHGPQRPDMVEQPDEG